MSEQSIKPETNCDSEVPPTIACCVCGTTDAYIWRLAGDDKLGGEARYRVLRCVSCGLARLDPRPAPEAMAQFYTPETYIRAEAKEDRELAKRLDVYNARLARRADFAVRSHAIKRVKQKRRALDVGCGDGRFLKAMIKRGWTGEGLETDGVAAELARRRTNSQIHETPLESIHFGETRFDLISLLHVLEHVPDPSATLNAARNALHSNGTLLLALPNIACLEANLFGNSWYPLDLPRHYWGFTPQTLTRLLGDNGFTVTSMRFFPFLFAPQSLRYALRSSKPTPDSNSEPTSAMTKLPSMSSRKDKLRTSAFLTLLSFSEMFGRVLPGEVMEVSAVINPNFESSAHSEQI